MIHIAWLVPHPKVLELFRDKVAVVGPNFQGVRVVAHAILDNRNHPAARLAPEVRMALVESGLVEPDQVGYTYPLQVELGWEQENE